MFGNRLLKTAYQRLAGLVPLEAVSPILIVKRNCWINEINEFWDGWDRTFTHVETSDSCSTHVHISTEGSGDFSLQELWRIAFGAIIYEPLILQVLPYHRWNNLYCRPNTTYATELAETLDRLQCARHYYDDLWWELQSQHSKHELRDFMQKGQGHNRHVLWNFDNTYDNGSGSVEFRGAPGVTNGEDTVAWALFTIGFVNMCLTRVCRLSPLLPLASYLWEDIV